MTLEERKQVHQIVVEQAKNRITIVAHVGTTSTKQSIELALHAQKVGADYVASISPYYHRHDERTIISYFKSLVENVTVPVYVYNNPKASGVTITPAFLQHLADVGVKGIKDSAFSYIEFVHSVLAMRSYDDFRFIIGTEGIALPAFMAGAKGCVSGLANVFPELMVALWNAYQHGDYEKAAKLQLRVVEARQILHIPSSTNAACYAVLKARGIDPGQPKEPILPVVKEKEKAMLEAFRNINLL
jgi:N-acetylneuraminate lyase/4-hydroxy-tetrahydrodipicolinate synthase